jgi:hypothetical protein
VFLKNIFNACHDEKEKFLVKLLNLHELLQEKATVFSFIFVCYLGQALVANFNMILLKDAIDSYEQCQSSKTDQYCYQKNVKTYRRM